MITIYVAPNDGNQVMAYYDNCRPEDSSPYTSQGFVEIEVSDDHPQHAELKRLKRNCQFNGITATERINPIQPTPSVVDARITELASKLADDSITFNQLKELMRLREN
jgi:ribosomal protein S21